MYPYGTQLKNELKVLRHDLIKAFFTLLGFSMNVLKTNMQSSKMLENCSVIAFFNYVVLNEVICSFEKSKISSDKSLRI